MSNPKNIFYFWDESQKIPDFWGHPKITPDFWGYPPNPPNHPIFWAQIGVHSKKLGRNAQVPARVLSCAVKARPEAIAEIVMSPHMGVEIDTQHIK